MYKKVKMELCGVLYLTTQESKNKSTHYELLPIKEFMKSKLEKTPINILLADDDLDDCLFFEKALGELSVASHLTAVNDGEQLMNYLNEKTNVLPDIIFLDLSMPRKTGIECLNEINENDKFKGIDVVIFSTSFGRDVEYEQRLINMLSTMGARDYIRKPGGFEELKKIIHAALIKIKKL